MDVVRRFLRFGPFSLDRESCRLRRDGQVVQLPRRHRQVLRALTEEAGTVVTIEALIAAGWRHAVGDDSLYKVIGALRRLCDPFAPDGESIPSCRHEGYRFAIPCVTSDTDSPPTETRNASKVEWLSEAADSGALLAFDTTPQTAVRRGRQALETLALTGVHTARDTFASMLAELDGDDLASAHTGVAAALWLQFESTRADGVPDLDALLQAQRHVLAAARRNPQSATAWATLALVRHRRGLLVDAIDAAVRAVSLAPKEWRVHLVHAFVSGGAARLAAAYEGLRLTPNNPIAHWLAATVYIARQAFPQALEHIVPGCRIQDLQRLAPAAERFPVVGLLLLHGLVLNALGESEAARAAFARELTFEDSGHVFTREACAQACYALGAMAWHDGDRDGARQAFEQALVRVPEHPLAVVALRAISAGRAGQAGVAGRAGRAEVQTGVEHSTKDGHDAMRSALAHAVALAVVGRHADAAGVVMDALVASPVPVPGGVWSLPVDPLLNVTAHPDAWAVTLALLQRRAF